MFTEGGLQVRHLLEVVDETWTHFTLEQWVGPQEVCDHLSLADQSISERKRRGEKEERKGGCAKRGKRIVISRCSSPTRVRPTVEHLVVLFRRLNYNYRIKAKEGSTFPLTELLPHSCSETEVTPEDECVSLHWVKRP